jgi:hypothetical protein
MIEEDEQDKLFRYLTRAPREEVYNAIMAYKSSISKRSELNPNVLRKILYKHGWTFSEYALYKG